MQPSGSSPGGPRVSSAKKRRLAALEQSLSAAGAPPNKRTARSPGQQPQGRGGRGSGRSPALVTKQAKPDQASQAGMQTPASPGAPGSASTAAAAAQPGKGEPVYYRLDARGMALSPAKEGLGLGEERQGYVVNAILEDLMATNPRAFDSRAAIGLKMHDRTLLLENPPAAAAAGRGQRRQGRRAFGRSLASRSQQRKLGLYDLRTAGLTYESVMPLHRRWQQYMQTLLSGAQPHQQQRAQQQAAGAASALASSTCLEDRLASADLHGCLLRVAESRDRRYQGLQGIVVRDTQQTFQLVTPDDRLMVVPKAPCTFEYDADARRTVSLLGSGLAKAAEAAAPAAGTAATGVNGNGFGRGSKRRKR